MTSDRPERTSSGFRVHAPLSDVMEILREHVEPDERSETVPLAAADGRVLVDAVAARRDVPHYRRAAMDGYAVRSSETAGASARSPTVLRVVDNPVAVGENGESRSGGIKSDADGPDDSSAAFPPGTAARVHTGSAVPDDADAVVLIEHVERIGGDGDGDGGRADEIELTDPVAAGDDVAPVGEDVTEGQALYEAGDRLRPSDLGLLKVAGHDEVAVRPRPTVGVVPTGEELVQRDPAPGEAVETNGLTVSRLVERWGGRAEYRTVVGDDRHALRAAIQRDLHRDLVVTTGGSSVGERDLLPEVVDDLGELLVHGVGIQPGHPVALGVVEETPVLCLPGYPVSCIVTAVQLLRPALKWCQGLDVDPPPTVAATLARKIDSEPGTRTFARVSLSTDAGDGASTGVDSESEDAGDDAESADRATVSAERIAESTELVAEPTRARGAGVLSSVGLADGWVEVPEASEGLPAGERVAVQDWEWSP